MRPHSDTRSTSCFVRARTDSPIRHLSTAGTSMLALMSGIEVPLGTAKAETIPPFVALVGTVIGQGTGRFMVLCGQPVSRSARQGRLTTTMLSAYGIWSLGTSFVDAQVGMNLGDSARRTMPIYGFAAKSNPNGAGAEFSLAGGRVVKTGGFQLTPMAGIRIDQASQGGLTESDAGGCRWRSQYKRVQHNRHTRDRWRSSTRAWTLQ